MTWFRVDDGFPDHPKLEALESDPRAWAECVALWTVGGCYCSRSGTSGFISDERLGRLSPLKNRARIAAEKLVEIGLWERVDGGFFFHDWEDFNPSGDEISHKKRLRNERQKRWRKGKTENVDASQRLRVDDQVPARARAFPSRPVPSRPDLSLTREGEGEGARAPSQNSPERPNPIVEALEPVDEPSGDEVERAHRLLVGGYQRRYEARYNRAWASFDRNYRDIRQVAVWCIRERTRTRVDLAKLVDELLDVAFEVLARGDRPPPWKWISEDPSALYMRRTATRTRIDPSARRELAEEMHRLATEADRADERGDDAEAEKLRAAAEKIHDRLKQSGGNEDGGANENATRRVAANRRAVSR